MKCWRIKRLLSAYLDGLLAVRVRNALQDHLEECSACGEELEWLRITRTALANPSFPAPPHDFTQRTLARISEDGRHRRRPVWLPVAAPRLAWAACGVLLIGGWAVWRLTSRGVQPAAPHTTERLANVAPPVGPEGFIPPKQGPSLRRNIITTEPAHRGRTPGTTRDETPVASARATGREKLLAQARAFAARGSFGEAIALLRPVYDRDPGDRPVSLALARFLADAGKPDEAEKVCAKLLQEGGAKTAGQLHVLLASAYESAGLWPDALRHHAAAARVLPNYPLDGAASIAGNRILTSARSLIAEGESRQALDKCQTLLQHFSPESRLAQEARLVASQSFGVMGDKTLEGAFLAHGVVLTDDTPTVNGVEKQPTEEVSPGPTLAEEKPWRRALALVESAGRVAQDSPDSREARERYRQAKNILEQIAGEEKLEPQVSEAKFRLTFAQVREALGDRQGAIRDYALVANNHPDTEEAEIAKQRLAGLT